MKKEITFETKDIVLLIGAIVGSILICGAFFHLGIEYGYRHASVVEMHNCVDEPRHSKTIEPSRVITTTTADRRSKGFVDNEVMVSFQDKATEEQIKKAISSVKGLKSYTDDYGIYVLELNFSFNTIYELNQFCKEFVANNKNVVKYCEANHIITIPDCSKGPC